MNHRIALFAALAALGLSSSALAEGGKPDKKTERLWKSKCSSCHGEDGKADTEKGKQMKMAQLTSPEVQKKSDADLKKAIEDGTKTEKDGVKKEMDPFKEELKPEQLDALVGYIRSLGK